MRFSAVFDPKLPMRTAQAEDRAEETRAAAPSKPPVTAQSLPDDLDQRVRQSGEWQLEDW